MSERQAPVARPDRTLFSGHDAEVMFLGRRKRQGGEGGASQPVEAGVGSDPYGALAIHHDFPYGVGAEPSLGVEAFPGSTGGRPRCGPLVNVVKPSQTLIAYRPD